MQDIIPYVTNLELPNTSVSDALGDIYHLTAVAHAMVASLATKGNTRQLTDFLQSSVILLNDLHCDTAQPQAVLERLQHLHVAYQDKLAPMLSRLHNFAKDKEGLKNIFEIASIGSEVMACSTQTLQYAYNGKLSPTDTQYALSGSATMLAGMGLLFTMVTNPTAGFPCKAGVIVLKWGCKFCRMAMDTHNSPEQSANQRSIAVIEHNSNALLASDNNKAHSNEQTNSVKPQLDHVQQSTEAFSINEEKSIFKKIGSSLLRFAPRLFGN